jgi:hypothetical protein
MPPRYGQGTQGLIGQGFNTNFNAYGMGNMPGLDGGYDSTNFGAVPMGNTGTGQIGGAAAGSRRLNPFQQYGKTFNNASTLGKFGMGLGTLGLASGVIGGLGKLFGGRQGPSDEEIEMEALARSGMGQADAFGGEMSSMGMGLQNSGRSMLERGRSGYLNALMDPNIASSQRARLASELAQSRRGVGNTVGLIGGPLAGAQFARNASAYTPQFAQQSSAITNDQFNRGLQANQARMNMGQQDYGQGLGLRNQGYGIQSQGRAGLQNTLGRIDAAAQQRRLASQNAIGGLFKTAGAAASGGLF